MNARNTAWNCATNNTAGITLNKIQGHRNFFIHHSPTPTHYPASGATPSTIDLMLTNSTLLLSALVSLNHELRSDHAPIVCSIDASMETKNTSSMFLFKEADWIRYQICINSKIERNAVISNIEDIDRGLEHLRKVLPDAKEIAVPVVRKQTNYIRISLQTKIAITGRNMLNRQWQQFPQKCRYDQRANG